MRRSGTVVSGAGAVAAASAGGAAFCAGSVVAGRANAIENARRIGNEAARMEFLLTSGRCWLGCTTHHSRAQGWVASGLRGRLINWMDGFGLVRQVDDEVGDGSHDAGYEPGGSAAGVGVRLAGRLQRGGARGRGSGGARCGAGWI